MYMLRHMEMFYLASIYIFICMHMCFNDQVKDLNVFTNVFEEMFY